jgi:hypothetical protein
MGFLNHSTNNIIIDAVLTEVGREALSEGGERSKITSFKLADDEVDYSILEQYGLIIGKEKIEKNTPIFEAITDHNRALKYPIRDFTNNVNTNIISVFPSFALNTSTTNFEISSNLSANSVNNIDIDFKSFVNQDETFTLDSQLIDSSVTVKVFSKLLKISGLTGEQEGEFTIYDNVSVDSKSIDFTNQVVGKINITVSGVVTDSTYKYYSTSSDSTVIKTQVEITGNQSGAKLVVPVTIKSSTVS